MAQGIEVIPLACELHKHPGSVRVALLRETHEGCVVASFAGQLDNLIRGIAVAHRGESEQVRLVAALHRYLDQLTGGVRISCFRRCTQDIELVLGH